MNRESPTRLPATRNFSLLPQIFFPATADYFPCYRRLFSLLPQIIFPANLAGLLGPWPKFVLVPQVIS
jgi:hypothetical protein